MAERKFKITIDLLKCKTAEEARAIIDTKFAELRKMIQDAERKERAAYG
jgi:hypothetical protein